MLTYIAFNSTKRSQIHGEWVSFRESQLDFMLFHRPEGRHLPVPTTYMRLSIRATSLLMHALLQNVYQIQKNTIFYNKLSLKQHKVCKFTVRG